MNDERSWKMLLLVYPDQANGSRSSGIGSVKMPTTKTASRKSTGIDSVAVCCSSGALGALSLRRLTQVSFSLAELPVWGCVNPSPELASVLAVKKTKSDSDVLETSAVLPSVSCRLTKSIAHLNHARHIRVINPQGRIQTVLIIFAVKSYLAAMTVRLASRWKRYTSRLQLAAET